jgi:hypothetical protein
VLCANNSRFRQPFDTHHRDRDGGVSTPAETRARRGSTGLEACAYISGDIWRVQNGKLAEHWDLVDTVGLQKPLHGE